MNQLRDKQGASMQDVPSYRAGLTTGGRETRQEEWKQISVVEQLVPLQGCFVDKEFKCETKWFSCIMSEFLKRPGPNVCFRPGKLTFHTLQKQIRSSSSNSQELSSVVSRPSVSDRVLQPPLRSTDVQDWMCKCHPWSRTVRKQLDKNNTTKKNFLQSLTHPVSCEKLCTLNFTLFFKLQYWNEMKSVYVPQNDWEKNSKRLLKHFSTLWPPKEITKQRY